MVGTTANRFSAAASRFLAWLPALALALLCARGLELALGLSRVPGAGRGELVALALALDALALLRGLPLLFVLSLPVLLLRSPRAGLLGVGVLWSLLIAAQGVLVQYFLTAGVPLGSDLFGYTRAEIAQTASDGATIDPAALLAVLAPVAVLWAVLLPATRWTVRTSPALAFGALAAGLAALLVAPGQARVADHADAHPLALDKGAFFVEESLAYALGRGEDAPAALAAPEPAPIGQAPAPAAAGMSASVLPAGDAAPGAAAAPADPAPPETAFGAHDPRYPFLHADRTPDVLGPRFHRAPAPPNLLFVLVEGLGRSFSGPGAPLGSFTPFLDELAGKSLYFENFLANQGRTFAVLPTVFGSLPFGAGGFCALGPEMPPHASLLSVLKAQGYHLRFYAGFNSTFDNERAFLDRQGVDVVVDAASFGPEFIRGPSSWGYADGELVKRILLDEAAHPPQPFVSVVQTMTMHTSYRFPGQEAYEERFERRLDELRVAEADRAGYREFAKIYRSILYADDALRRLFEGLAATPAWANTIVVVTGDHRLPELPMGTRIERFHVPLIIHSPLLKAPARIKSVSSQFDIAPSLLAYLGNNYGIRTPGAVTWVGSGLDLEPSFRNLHDFPMKHAKTELLDFVSGPWYLNQGTAFALSDGLLTEPVDDAAVKARLQARFAAFRAANDRFARELALMPEDAARQLAAWTPRQEPASAATPAAAGAVVAVREVRARDLRPGQRFIEVVFANSGTAESAPFVPLVVLLAGDGREISESYGTPLQLAPGQEISLQLPVKADGVPAGSYFLTVLPSHPATGKRVGAGRYRIPVHVEG